MRIAKSSYNIIKKKIIPSIHNYDIRQKKIIDHLGKARFFT